MNHREEAERLAGVMAAYTLSTERLNERVPLDAIATALDAAYQRGVADAMKTVCDVGKVVQAAANVRSTSPAAQCEHMWVEGTMCHDCGSRFDGKGWSSK